MLTPLSAPPPQISPEQHDALTSSTPSSFTDIPPVLRFQDDEVELVMTPSSGWQGYEGKVKGQLWVTEAAVSFIPSGASGFTLPYPTLTLHALTPASADSPAHVYCQIDASDEGELMAPIPHDNTANGINGDEADEGDAGGDEFTAMREIRIYLPDSKLQPLFAALSQCSALHASLMPSGEPSSFFGFGDMGDGPDDDEGWEDAQEDEEDGDAEDGGEAGRVIASHQLGGGEVDQVDRFLSMVDWGNVRKPLGWNGEGEKGEFEDAEEDTLAGEVSRLDVSHTP